MLSLQSGYALRPLLCHTRHFSTSSPFSNALKVAFFGSDEFSIQSLRRLHEASKQSPGLISHIDLIAKHPKATGRDLKTISDVPIVSFAQDNHINVIRAESTSEINDLVANNYTMAIAVSYGKLIPKKFLSAIPYSLNVHPSLLPRYSGASPLQFALLNHDTHTGVTVQTLHPTEFDRGEIVAQTPEIPIAADETLTSLRDRLAVEGAKLLVQVVKDGSYKDPQLSSKYEYSYASKITPQMAEIDWGKSTRDIIRQYNTLGPLHTFKEIKIKKRRKPLVHEWRRVILSDISDAKGIEDKQPGEFELGGDQIIIKTSDGAIAAKYLQLEFEKKEEAMKFWSGLPKKAGDTPYVFTQKQ
ncbi:Methionyl-tRNA formyltransferase, mitochondrial [Cyberlindnera fabianii]|uniref:Methionyl-tRNA formyltransferase, mitochondrial n=1 Tax=Cyberlindnera fabianii TaxID=36022 RepID=A0A1V2LCI0_CYBFA|nr:Methionyl-tRNA formyltransferase, mitochondrial [Cyberlindnera fabianii]